MKGIQTKLNKVVEIQCTVYGDDRGFFKEVIHPDKLAEFGINHRFVQLNHSKSQQGILRGLHYQLNKPQGKLVRVVSGAVFDVAVDIRKGSPSFGRWVGVELTAQNFRQLYVPPGFAHGFVTLSENTEFLYKCTEYYDPSSEYGVAWDDPDIAIEWPVDSPALSEKDNQNKSLKQLTEFLPEYSS